MSIIAFDGRIIAADCQGQSADFLFKTTKIRCLPNGDIVAFAGTLENGMNVALWYENGADPKLWPDSQKGDEWSQLIVVSKGHLFMYEQLPIKQPIIDPIFAWGSGRDFAIGAMAMGANAKEAIKIASRFCTSCGGGIDSFPISRPSEEPSHVTVIHAEPPIARSTEDATLPLDPGPGNGLNSNAQGEPQP